MTANTGRPMAGDATLDFGHGARRRRPSSRSEACAINHAPAREDG